MTNTLVFTMGIDPGGTSGWSVIGVPSRTIYRDYPGKISLHEYGEVTGNYTEQVLKLMHIAASQKYYPLAIALEDFEPRKNIQGEAFFSPMLINARIQFCIDTHYILAPLFYQMPSLAMDTASDERLKRWNLYVPGPDHTKDATRHAITFIRRAKADEDLRYRAWGEQN
jgi:hypothetical protein